MKFGTETAIYPFIRLVEKLLFDFEPARPFDSRVEDHQFERSVGGSEDVLEGFSFPVGSDFFFSFLAKRKPHFDVWPLFSGDL